MATPILRIPIDDGAFQRYLAAFKKYQEELKAQPDVWQGVNDTILETVDAGAKLVDMIDKQVEATQELAEQERKRDEDAEKREKREDDAAKRRQKRDDDESKRRRRAIQEAKDYSKAIGEAALTFGKWAIGGGALGLATGALGLWGLGSFVSGVGQERRAAQGVGVSMGQRQGLELNLQRYFDVNSTLSNIAAMQNDPSQWGRFAALGINPRGRDVADLTGEAALRARDLYKRNPILAQQQLQGLFSPEDLRRLASEDRGTLQAAISRGRTFGGLSDATGRKWQDFMIKVEETGLKLKNSLIDKLTALEPQFARIIDGFGNLAKNVLDNINWDAINAGLKSFADAINDGTFKKNFDLLLNDLGKLASGIHWLIGLFPSETTNVSGTGAGSMAIGAATGFAAGGPLGALAGAGSGGVVAQGEKASARQEFIARTIMGMGWSTAQTKGLLANIGAESTYNPFAQGDYNWRTRKYEAYGLGQWHADRQANYKKLFGHTMQSVKDERQAIMEQLRFMNWELNDPRSGYKSAGDELRRAQDAYSAGYIVSRKYERPAGGIVSAAGRGATAVTIRLSNQTGASVATTVNSAAAH